MMPFLLCLLILTFTGCSIGKGFILEPTWASKCMNLELGEGASAQVTVSGVQIILSGRAVLQSLNGELCEKTDWPPVYPRN